MTPLPRIAVVIPCYNAQDWIGRAIGSVLAQGYGDLVMIVVDDGSSDASADRVRDFGDRVILQSGPNRGANHARNQGLRLAQERGADYILFLDADDYLEGEMLAGATDVAARTGADMVLSEMHLEHPDGTREERFLYSGQVAPETFFDGWLHGQIFHPASILWRLAFVQQVGGWDESLMQSQDTDICLRAMFETPLIMKNDRGLAIYANVNPGSLSQNASGKSTEDRITVMARLIKRTSGTSLEPYRPLLMAKLYTITRTAFRLKQVDLGRRGIQELASFGFRGNPGSPVHRIASNLIGLEAKVRLWGN